MKDLAKHLGLSEDATEEQILNKVKEKENLISTLETSKKELESDKAKLTESVVKEKTRADTLEETYKTLLEKTSETKQEPKDLFEKLMNA